MSKKVFLDTCIWMELCVLSNPQNSQEIAQSAKATQLLSNIIAQKTEIISLDFQIIELMQVIMKTKMKECNKYLKTNNLTGVNNIKEFRNSPNCQNYLNQAMLVCESTYNDIKRISSAIDEYSIDVKSIISSLENLDVNDCIYYEYCKENKIDLYTFDNDFTKLDSQFIKVI